MNAIQQRCRPKHQVLVLKCYPRTTKGAVDVKPNSSELSYLLYYATSRRTKIQKVGAFLEKKTATDVWRLRIGNVQVTLQIVEALIEKNPKDLPLFAPTVLKILDLILRSNDITMVESSIPTFEAFCANHEASSLFADQAYLRQYEAVVRHYASLASTRLPPGKTQPSKPVAMRWRHAGLEAIRSVASADALSSIAGRQYDMVVPMILENLWTDNEDFLEVLQHRAEIEEKVDSERLLKRRTSIATVRTADTTGDTNPIALSGTATDVDKLAEEDIGVLAMQCLKQIYATPNRPQIHPATVALLKFIEERVMQHEPVVRPSHHHHHTHVGKDGGWAIKIYGLVAHWAPVQNRFIILTTTMETMARMPLADDTLDQHIVLAAMIGSLLRSDVNLIGLSVMDVLLGLLQHIKKLVQLPGDPSATAASGSSHGAEPTAAPAAAAAATTADSASRTSSQRKELLNRLQQCIGDLATHVYYADQISDMISAILQRLKPARPAGTANSSPEGEKTEDATASTTMSLEGRHVDSLFSLTVAKIAALKAIKAILLVANPKTKVSGNLGLSRNRVPIQVWEGTEWLLRDPDGHVRKAYTDAVLTWLDRETTGADLRARDDSAAGHRSAHRSGTGGGREFNAPPTPMAPLPGTASTSNMAKRVVSNGSSHRPAGENKQPVPAKKMRSYYLPLLHLVIYDNALQFVDYETDIVLLHVLLTKLVEQLGINAVRHGLPMVFQLQEAIQEVETPLAKVRIGSLVHGYFWALTERFDFDASVVGRAIHNEIVRRRSKNFWVEGVHVPPPQLEGVGTPGTTRPQPKMPLNEIESEALLPFDDRISLVECICTGYQETTTVSSPPQSPGASPSRSFSHPMLSSTLSGLSPPGTATSAAPMPTAPEAEREVPPQFREQMLSDWSREAVLVAVQAGSKSASLNGSRTGTVGTSRHRLAINGGAQGQNGGAGASGPSPFASQQNLRPSSQPVAGTNNNLAPLSKLRKSSVRSGVSPSPGSNSTRGGAGGFVTSVDQLKLALTGDIRPSTLGLAGGAGTDDDSGDSMVSYDMTASELSFNPAAVSAGGANYYGSASGEPGTGSATTSPVKRSFSGARRFGAAGESLGPLTSNPLHEAAEGANGDQDELDSDEVPPVPPLPSELTQQRASASISATSPTIGDLPGLPPTTPLKSSHSTATRRTLKSRGGESILSSSFGGSGGGGDEGHPHAMDLHSLLRNIDSRAGESTGLGALTRPPY